MKPSKPDKPYIGFPLFAHNAGVWAKKIKGKMHYFGPWADPQGALARYLDERPYYETGRTPPRTEVTVGMVLDGFLGEKFAKLSTGDIAQLTYDEYQTTCDVVADALGKDRPVSTIQPHDFTALRMKLAVGKAGQQYSPHTVKRRLTAARMIFAYGNEEMGLALRFKRNLQAPSKRMIRRNERGRAKKLYTALDIRKLVKAADPDLKAMILLGINCGFGPKDCFTLPLDCLDGPWHNYPRPKTEVDRRCPLWPETEKAMRAILGKKLVFDRKQWSRHIIAREFTKLCKKCKVVNHGFYSLRRTFETIATTAKVSQAVIDHIMGHSRNDMASTYRQEIFDSQLIECSDHVRGWYLGKVTV